MLFVGIVIGGSESESESLDLELRLAPPKIHHTTFNDVRSNNQDIPINYAVNSVENQDIDKTEQSSNKKKRKRKFDTEEEVS